MSSVQKTLVTHSGTFHADDIFACAVLQIFLEQQGESYVLVRTRDEEIIKQADYVFDVGGVYDHDAQRYDHHQKEYTEARANGISYAAFGLIWKHYGKFICDDEVDVLPIDKKFVQFIDATDTGYVTYDSRIPDSLIPEVYTMMALFNTTWTEDKNISDARFLELVAFARKILERLIIRARDTRKAEHEIAQAYEMASDKRILILDKYLPWHDFVKKYEEILFVVYPSDTSWHGYAVEQEQFVSKKPFLVAWGGLSEKELQELTGVPDALFAHVKQFLVVARSQEGVLDLVRQILSA